MKTSKNKPDNVAKGTLHLTGIICFGCGWVGVSWSRHDYKCCTCPNGTFIDGGFDYLRYGGVKATLFQLVHISLSPKETKTRPTT